MIPFHQLVNRIRWTPEPLDDYTVGYADRFEDQPVEIPLAEFLASEIPEHRARYVKKGGEVVWDRRR